MSTDTRFRSYICQSCSRVFHEESLPEAEQPEQQPTPNAPKTLPCDRCKGTMVEDLRPAAERPVRECPMCELCGVYVGHAAPCNGCKRKVCLLCAVENQGDMAQRVCPECDKNGVKQV